MKILISATKGAGMSLLQGLLTENVHIDPEFGTCHQSWEHPKQQHRHQVWSVHDTDLIFQNKVNPDITVGIWINPKNIIQICQRLVIVDFQYALDSKWVERNWAWNKEKHEQLAGPDWPEYSANINDYPIWCRNEMCQTAYNRSVPWMHSNLQFDYIIDSDELFGSSKPVTLQKLFDAVGEPLDLSIIRSWQEKNNQIMQEWSHLFSWQPQHGDPQYVCVGDSWALKAYTNNNYNIHNINPIYSDTRLSDYIKIPYHQCIAGGHSNLSLLDKLIDMKLPRTTPVVWVYTEPGRDYQRITQRPEFEWITREDIFDIRLELDRVIMHEIRQRLPNTPVAFIGGLSDVNTDLASSLGFIVLESSWQQWIAKTLNSQHFVHGWGASDIGWRAHANNITPSKSAIFAWDEQIKEWCHWEEQGYFCHEHPTPRANKEFAKVIAPKLQQWLDSVS